MVNTYVDHLPLNRQEMCYARRGAHLPRQRCANGSWRRLSRSKCGRYRCGLTSCGPPACTWMTRRRCSCSIRVARRHVPRDYGAILAPANARRTVSASTTRRRSCSSSRNRAPVRIRCDACRSTKVTCRRTRTADMAHATKPEASSRSDVGRDAQPTLNLRLTSVGTIWSLVRLTLNFLERIQKYNG
ncbi:hypothetical protein IQ287_33275 [Burkholderia sp. R-69927]|nr:hypothetical protein [Burkholderia sp. R-69927]MBK5123165.1 hypothetical protein [Burkholderia sp. R-69980]MBK5165027.1 hypothetical protein [Burkholderia sp. R-70211]